MNQPNMQDHDFLSNEKRDGLNTVRFIRRNLRLLAGAAVITGVSAVIISFFIPKKYSSTGIVFPTQFNSLEKSLDAMNFGYDVEADRLIQVLQSNEMMDSIVNRHDLVSYYRIDKNDRDWRHDLVKKYGRDITISRTPKMAVHITAEMKDPELAANVVNSIIGLADGIRERIIKKNVKQAFETLEKEYTAKSSIVDSLVGKIALIRSEKKINNLTLLDNQLVYIAESKTAFSNNTELEKLINEYNYHFSKFREISARYERARDQYAQPVAGIYVVDPAVPDYHKVSPSRLKNGLIGFAAGLIFAIVALVVRDKSRSLKSEI